nr:MAG TPA: hypothetical protein [Crassvirales sp.]
MDGYNQEQPPWGHLPVAATEGNISDGTAACLV